MESLCVNASPFRDKRHLRKSSTQGERRHFTVGLCVARHRAAGIFIGFTEGHRSFGTNSTSAIHNSSAASCKHPRNKGPSLGTIQVKSSHQRSPYALKFEDTIRPKINSNDFGSFWNQLADSNSIFVAAEIIFFERFEFLVCSKFSHTQCGRTCACAVACLCPHTIPFRML